MDQFVIAAAQKGHVLRRPAGLFLRLAQGAFPRCGDNSFRLAAEVRGHFSVSYRHLGGSKGPLAIAGGMSGDLCRLRALETRSLHLFFNLLEARARRIKVRLRVAPDFGCAALSRLDLIPASPDSGRGRTLAAA